MYLKLSKIILIKQTVFEALMVFPDHAIIWITLADDEPELIPQLGVFYDVDFVELVKLVAGQQDQVFRQGGLRRRRRRVARRE